MIILICSDINHVIDKQNILNGLIVKEFFYKCIVVSISDQQVPAVVCSWKVNCEVAGDFATLKRSVSASWF